MSAAAASMRPALERSSDPPLYWFMTLLFLATAVAGFAPSSAAILSGAVPVPPLVVHVHAACMLTWLILLVTQASLVRGGRLALHRRLGTVSYAVAVALLAAMVTVTIVRYGDITDVGAGPVASNILLLQIRSIVLFPAFYLWAIAARRTDLATHKRAMLFATLVLLDAAIARMFWLPGTDSTTTYDGVHLWLLALLVPAVVADLARLGKIHRVYVVGLAALAPFFVATHFGWNAPAWHAFAARLMGYGA